MVMREYAQENRTKNKTDRTDSVSPCVRWFLRIPTKIFPNEQKKIKMRSLSLYISSIVKMGGKRVGILYLVVNGTYRHIPIVKSLEHFGVGFVGLGGCVSE